MTTSILQRLKQLLGRGSASDPGHDGESDGSSESDEDPVVTVERRPGGEPAEQPESETETEGETDTETTEADDEREPDAPEHAKSGPAPDAAVDAIDGIGPTYAQRLQAAGIETVEELAAADTETVVEATNAAESRVEDWLEQARS